MKKTAWENRKLDVYRRKKGKLDTSHRYDLLPLLRSSPGGIQRELVVYDFPGCKGRHFLQISKNNYPIYLNTVKNQRKKVVCFLELPYFLSSYQKDAHRLASLGLVLGHDLSARAARSRRVVA